MPDVDEFGGVAVDSPDMDEFGGVALDAPGTDEFGGVLVSDKPANPSTDTLKAWNPSLMERARISPIGRAIFGPTDVEKEVRIGGDAPAPMELLNTAFKFSSVPPPLAEEIRTITDPAIKTLPKPAQGVAEGLRELGLTFPIAAGGASLGKGIGRILLGVFGGEYVLSLPDQKRAFDAARERGDNKEAAKIATQAIGGGAILGLGAAHEVGELRKPAETKIPNEPVTEPASGQLGQLPTTTEQRSAVEGERAVEPPLPPSEPSGTVVPSAVQPEPVAEAAPTTVAPPPEAAPQVPPADVATDAAEFARLGQELLKADPKSPEFQQILADREALKEKGDNGGFPPGEKPTTPNLSVDEAIKQATEATSTEPVRAENAQGEPTPPVAESAPVETAKKVKPKTVTQQFNDLALDYALKTDLPHSEILHGPLSLVPPGARSTYSGEIIKLRRKVFKELGLDNLDIKDPAHIKDALEKLKERMVAVDEKINTPEVIDPAEGGVELQNDNTPLTPEDWPTAKPSAVPKLRPGEKGTGDLLQGDDAPFNLTGEKATDYDRLAKEQEESLKAKEEARRLQDEQQQNLFGQGPGARTGTPSTKPEPAESYEGTGLKNAIGDLERISYGFKERAPTEKQNMAEAWVRAGEALKQNSEAGRQLAESLVDNPKRGLTGDESALLLRHKVALENALNDAAEKTISATPEGKESAQLAADQASHELRQFLDAVAARGSEWGREGRWRQAMAYEDYTFAAQERLAEAAKGSPLTTQEKTALAERVKEREAKVKELESQVAAHELKISEMEAQKAFNELNKTTPRLSKEIIDFAEKVVSGWEKKAVSAEARLKAKFARTNNLVPDLTIVSDLVEMALPHIGRIGLDAAKWSASMLEKFGDSVKPYLDEAWKKAAESYDRNPASKTIKKVKSQVQDLTAQVESAKESIKEKLSEGDDIYFPAQRLARAAIERGAKTWREVVDAVHKDLKSIDPEWDYRDTMDAISGHGRFRPPSNDKITKQLGQIKQEINEVRKIQEVIAKEPVKKSGFGFQENSALKRRLTQVYEEVKRKFGTVVTDPARQLRSAIQATEKRLTNQIADLEHEIETKTKIVRAKTPSPTSPEIESLKARRDELKVAREELFGKPERTDAQKIQSATNALEKSITEYERRIKEGDISRQNRGSTTPSTPALESLKLRRDALRDQLQEIRDLDQGVQAEKFNKSIEVKQKTLQKQIDDLDKRIKGGDLEPRGSAVNRPLRPELEPLRQQRDALQKELTDARKALKPVKTPEERALQSAKTRMTSRIADLQERLDKKDFSDKPKREAPQNTETTKLKFELEKINRKFQEERFKFKMANRTPLQKTGGLVGEVLNTSRALLTSFDLSAVLRQGGFIGIGNPARTAKALPAMFKALLSEKNQFTIEQEILNRPNAPLYRKAGLFLSDQHGNLSKMEEQYMSRWASKIPGVGASERAYTTFLNRLRADSFDAMAKGLSKSKELSPVEAKAIANYVNVATGRGKFGMTENAAVGLNTIFFSPRYMASRFNLLGAQPLYKGTARTRIAIAKEYAKFLTGAAVVYGLASASGASIETDPRSSDFGKIRFGNVRIDPMTGLLQDTVLMSRLASGETKKAKGNIVPIRGKVPFGSPKASDVVATFVRSKLAPIPSAALDAVTGTDVIGQPVTISSSLQKTLVPISGQDIYNAMKEEGIAEGTILGILSIFGMGIQDYDARAKRPKP